jgi:hypothetical protein
VNASEGGALAIASCPALSRLRVLRLLGNNRVTAAGAALLADSPHLGRLLRLDLSGRGINRAGRERFGPWVNFGY